jgi:hypothetical protein
MQKTLLFAATAATSIALAGCHNQPEQINDYDPQAAALKNAAPVELPPAITDSRTFRCSDNSLIYVDFYSNNTALIRTTRDGAPTTLAAPGGTPPYAADGYSVSANGTHVRITAPGKNNLACHT